MHLVGWFIWINETCLHVVCHVLQLLSTHFTFIGLYIVVYFYSKTNYMHNFHVYWISLYMFRTVFPSIIRSSRLYIQSQVYVIQVSWLLASGPASKQSTNLYDIYLTLYVQFWTPDDGRKDRPKHVEWYSINSKIVHLVGFAIEILSTNTRRLTTRIRSEKCVVRRFHHCAKVIERTYTNLDSTA